MSKVPRWIWFLLGITAVVTIGVSVSTLATNHLIRKPTGEFVFAVDTLDRGGFVTVARQIQTARAEVIVCAKTISSSAILEALAEADSRGVSVKIVMDGGANPDATRGAVGFLRAKKLPFIKLTRQPLNTQFLVIDTTLCFTTAAPWTAKATKEISPITLTAHPRVGAEMAALFSRIAEGSRSVE